MAIVLGVSGKSPIEVDADPITIGSDPANTIAVTDDDRIKPRHAVIRRVAGRWLVEVREAEAIRVGNSELARVHWLNLGDVIRLVDNGPEITFQPSRTTPSTYAVPAVPVSAAPTAAQVRPPVEPPPARQPDSLFEPLVVPPPPSVAAPRAVVPWDAPVEKTSRRSPLDAIFEPETRSSVADDALPRVPAAEREAGCDATPSSRKLKNRQGKESVPKTIKVADDSDPDSGHADEEPHTPMLSRMPDREDDEAGSDSMAAWALVWVIGGLGILALLAVVWLASGPAK